MVSGSGGEIVGAISVEASDRGVPQRGEVLRGVTGGDARAVFAEHFIADPRQAVLDDAPVAADDR